MPSSNNLADYTATTDLKTIRAVGSCDFPHVIKFYAGLIDRVWQDVPFVAFDLLILFSIELEGKSSGDLYGSVRHIYGEVLRFDAQAQRNEIHRSAPQAHDQPRAWALRNHRKLTGGFVAL